MNFINTIKNNLPPLLRFFCRSRENGNPESANNNLDSRLRGNDRKNYSTKNLPPTTYHLQPSSGFTLIETLVAISILMIAVVSPLTIAQKGLASAIYAKDQIIASYLAQDAIEYLRNVSDQNVASGVTGGWLSGISDNCGNACTVNTRLSTGGIASCAGGTCDTLKYNTSTHIYNHDTDSNNIVSPFTRTVKVAETVPGVEALVKVNISWTDKSITRSLDFYTRIFNWR